MDTTTTTGSTIPNNTNTPNGSPQKVVDRVAQTAHETVDRLAAVAGPAIEKLRTGASSAGETLNAKADAFGALEEQWIASARNYVRDHPITAVTLGVLAGVLIAKLSGGRSE